MLIKNANVCFEVYVKKFKILHKWLQSGLKGRYWECSMWAKIKIPHKIYEKAF
jgi:hypothetical protein